MNYNKMMKLKKTICSDYIYYYVNKGYLEVSPLPLNYRDDVTLDFTTCTICSAKKNIKETTKG